MGILSHAVADRWFSTVGLVSIAVAFLAFVGTFSIRHRHWSKVARVAAFLAFLGTSAGYYLGNIRDEYSSAELKDTNERLKATTQKLSDTTDKLSETDRKLSKTTDQLERNRADAEAARADAALAHADAALAHASAAEASEGMDRLRQNNLKLQRDLDTTKEKTLGVEASIAPRELTAEQRSDLVESIKTIKKPISIKIVILGDIEANGYGMEMLSSLQEAGAILSIFRIGVMSPPQYGVGLALNPSNEKSQAILAAFRRAHIRVEPQQIDSSQFDAQIVVGLRPPGHN